MNAIRKALFTTPLSIRFKNLLKNVSPEDPKTGVTSKMFVNAMAELTDNFKRPVTADEAREVLSMLRPRMTNHVERADLSGTIGNQIMAWSGEKDYSPGARKVLLTFIHRVDAHSKKYLAAHPAPPYNPYESYGS